MSRGLEPGDTGLAFDLPNATPDGPERCSLADLVTDNGCVVVFTCNHCPYVIHIRESFSAFAAEYQSKGLGVVAICSNDVATHPAAGPEKMKAEALAHGFPFPYLHD